MHSFAFIRTKDYTETEVTLLKGEKHMVSGIFSKMTANWEEK